MNTTNTAAAIAGQRIGYVRVSSVDQNTERQLEGVPVDRTFTDKASGKDTARVELQSALKYVRAGDTLVCHSMDRLARNAEDLLKTVRELTERAVSVEFIKEKLVFSADHADPMAHLMLTMMAGFAQFERSLIRERQREGIAVAKSKGVYKGRKPSLTPAQVDVLKARVAEGVPKSTVARDAGISRETLYQYLKQEQPA
jgi:DNA invertase Pin-like site-specific DNA recombinase